MHPVLLDFRSAAAVAVPMGRFLHARWYIDARPNAHRSRRGALARTAAVLMRIAAAVGALAHTAAVLVRIAAAVGALAHTAAVPMRTAAVVGRYLTRITAIRGAAARPGQPRRPAGGRPERPARGGVWGGRPPECHSPWVRSQRISASMKSSISPSITAVVFPVSRPVRRSLMFWYGCRT